jgi:hypothetical protein
MLPSASRQTMIEHAEAVTALHLAHAEVCDGLVEPVEESSHDGVISGHDHVVDAAGGAPAPCTRDASPAVNISTMLSTEPSDSEVLAADEEDEDNAGG